MQSKHSFHPFYWVLTIFAALMFHHSAQANPTQLNKLYASLASLEFHGLSSDYYQGKLKDTVKTYGIKDIAHEQIDVFLGDLVADLRYGVTRNKPMDQASDQAIEVRQLVADLRHCMDMVACYQSIAARHAEYRPLQKKLAEYKVIEKQGGWPNIAAGKTLKPGMNDSRVMDVTRLLIMTGDYTYTAPTGSYDDMLVEAVKHFQQRHGLEVDGTIGPKTRATMNVPPRKRIDQIELSLERLRNLPNADGHHIRVNIPSYKLQAFEDDKQVLSMDVIVGKTSRPTPIFSNYINTLVVNPTWTPTARILRQDILPKVRNNPSYIANGNYVVTDRHTGQKLDPYSVDWKSTSVSDVRVVQRSGSRNALGKVKFLLPENDSVYLHDTSHRELFSKSYRALSSGCIRLSDPQALLSYVASAQSAPIFQKVDDYYQSSTRRNLKVDNPIHVQMTYFTAWVDESGNVNFYDDVYKKDARKELAMAKHSRAYAAR